VAKKAPTCQVCINNNCLKKCLKKVQSWRPCVNYKRDLADPFHVTELNWQQAIMTDSRLLFFFLLFLPFPFSSLPFPLSLFSFFSLFSPFSFKSRIPKFQLGCLGELARAPQRDLEWNRMQPKSNLVQFVAFKSEDLVAAIFKSNQIKSNNLFRQADTKKRWQNE